jgi:hypothetical protein
MNDPITELYTTLFTNYLTEKHKAFCIWVMGVQVALFITVLSMISVVWFVSWWWKLGLSLIVLLVIINWLNQNYTKSLFQKWYNKR